MDSPNEISNKSFIKYISTLAGIGIILFGSIYIRNSYKKQQQIDKNIAFYNQFTDDEYLYFAQELETSIIDNRPDFFDSKVNTKSFLSFSDKELSESFNKRKISEILGPIMKFGSIIAGQIYPYGDFRFNRFYKEEGIPHFVYRIYDGEIIYFIDFTVGINDNKLVLNDSYYYFSGITMSENVSNLYYKAVNLDRQYLSNIETYNKIKYYNENEDHDRAYEVLTAIPAKYHDALYFQYLLIAVTYQDSDQFQAVINKMVTATPDDDKLHTYLYFLESVYTGNLETLDSHIQTLTQHVGTDPIFDFYKGIIYFDNENPEEAVLYFDKTIEEMPTFFDGYYFKLYSLLTLNKPKKALKVIADMKANFFLSEEDLTFDLKEFESFVNSPSYKELFADEE